MYCVDKTLSNLIFVDVVLPGLSYILYLFLISPKLLYFCLSLPSLMLCMIVFYVLREV